MMMMPSIFSENLFDDFFDNGFAMLPAMNASNALYGKHAHNIMKTDVRETDNSYELDIDLPGFKKDEIKLDLKNGYLTISASKGLDKEEKDKKGRYIRQERYAGACSRSFYVGDAVEPEPEGGADIMNIRTEKSMLLRQDIRKFAESNPEIAAQMLKNWLRGGEENE